LGVLEQKGKIKESDIDIRILIDPKKVKDKDYEQLKDEYYLQTLRFSGLSFICVNFYHNLSSNKITI